MIDKLPPEIEKMNDAMKDEQTLQIADGAARILFAASEDLTNKEVVKDIIEDINKPDFTFSKNHINNLCPFTLYYIFMCLSNAINRGYEDIHQHIIPKINEAAGGFKKPDNVSVEDFQKIIGPAITGAVKTSYISATNMANHIHSILVGLDYMSVKNPDNISIKSLFESIINKPDEEVFSIYNNLVDKLKEHQKTTLDEIPVPTYSNKDDNNVSETTNKDPIIKSNSVNNTLS